MNDFEMNILFDLRKSDSRSMIMNDQELIKEDCLRFINGLFKGFEYRPDYRN